MNTENKRRMEEIIGKMVKIVRVRVMRQVMDKVQGVSLRVGEIREKARRIENICER